MFSLTYWCLYVMKEKKNQKGEAMRVKSKLLLKKTMENFQLHITVLKLDKNIFLDILINSFPLTVFIHI